MYERYDEQLDALKDKEPDEFNKVWDELKQKRDTYLEYVKNMISENDRVFKRKTSGIIHRN